MDQPKREKNGDSNFNRKNLNEKENLEIFSSNLNLTDFTSSPSNKFGISEAKFDEEICEEKLLEICAVSQVYQLVSKRQQLFSQISMYNTFIQGLITLSSLICHKK